MFCNPCVDLVAVIPLSLPSLLHPASFYFQLPTRLPSSRRTARPRRSTRMSGGRPSCLSPRRSNLPCARVHARLCACACAFACAVASPVALTHTSTAQPDSARHGTAWHGTHAHARTRCCCSGRAASRLAKPASSTTRVIRRSNHCRHANLCGRARTHMHTRVLACMVSQEEGCHVILMNPNIATVQACTHTSCTLSIIDAMPRHATPCHATPEHMHTDGAGLGRHGVPAAGRRDDG